MLHGWAGSQAAVQQGWSMSGAAPQLLCPLLGHVQFLLGVASHLLCLTPRCPFASPHTYIQRNPPKPAIARRQAAKPALQMLLSAYLEQRLAEKVLRAAGAGDEPLMREAGAHLIHHAKLAQLSQGPFKLDDIGHRRLGTAHTGAQMRSC